MDEFVKWWNKEVEERKYDRLLDWHRAQDIARQAFEAGVNSQKTIFIDELFVKERVRG